MARAHRRLVDVEGLALGQATRRVARRVDALPRAPDATPWLHDGYDMVWHLGTPAICTYIADIRSALGERESGEALLKHLLERLGGRYSRIVVAGAADAERVSWRGPIAVFCELQ